MGISILLNKNWIIFKVIPYFYSVTRIFKVLLSQNGYLGFIPNFV